MISRWIKLIFAALGVLLIYMLVGCASAPKAPEEEVAAEPPAVETPAVKTPAVETPEEAPPVEEPPAVEPLRDEEIQQARDAIARAKAVDAEYYEPGLLAEAEDALETALQLRESDPEGARQKLSQAGTQADGAYDSSVNQAATALRTRMQRLVDQLKAIQAHRFLPDEYQEAVSGVDQAEQSYQQGMLLEAKEQAFQALRKMSKLNEDLQERQRWIQILKRDINQYFQEAERLEAHRRAPEAFEQANLLYLQGIEAYQKYQLSGSEELLTKARDAARAVIDYSRNEVAQERRETRGLMLQVKRELEEASGLTVVTEEGNVIEPEPWSGDRFLPEEEPSTPGGAPAEGEAAPEAPPAENQSLLLPRIGETVVLGDIVEENFLKQAKELWKQGIEEWNRGNYQQAEEYFQESRRLIGAYKQQSANADYPVYVVRLNPEQPECLWRIAGYDFIYGNPYLWPKIWRRNRKLIPHPDVIHPGLKLVIPPK